MKHCEIESRKSREGEIKLFICNFFDMCSPRSKKSDQNAVSVSLRIDDSQFDGEAISLHREISGNSVPRRWRVEEAIGNFLQTHAHEMLLDSIDLLFEEISDWEEIICRDFLRNNFLDLPVADINDFDLNIYFYIHRRRFADVSVQD